MKRSSLGPLRQALRVLALLPLLVVLAVAGVHVYLSPSLPSADAMRKVELQVPLRVYTRSGGVISQIGEQRRIPVTYEQIPEVVRQAVLAAEDDRFFSHHGIDWTGVLRAIAVNLVSAERAQGASTITMQAARNMFLSLDKTWRRKLQEVFVTYRMERDFTKQEILATYLNVIFFGQRSYGVAAAAETYFGKTLSQLSVSEAATLAGIIQVPSRYNPMTNPSTSRRRAGPIPSASSPAAMRRWPMPKRPMWPNWHARKSSTAMAPPQSTMATRCSPPSMAGCRPRPTARCG